MTPSSLRRRIVDDLVKAGHGSPYAADANEPDPRYRGYGVRAAAMRDINAKYKAEIRSLSEPQKLALATTLVESGYGEQKGVALRILERMPAYFTPDRFDVLDRLMRGLHVVLFTRKVARSGKYTDVALAHCDNLKHDPQDMVRKGVGWSLKDVMRADRKRVVDYVVSLRQQGVSSVITLYALRDIKGAERARILAKT